MHFSIYQHRNILLTWVCLLLVVHQSIAFCERFQVIPENHINWLGHCFDGFADVSTPPIWFDFISIDIPAYRYFCPRPSVFDFRSPPAKCSLSAEMLSITDFRLLLFWFDFQLNFFSEFEYPALSFVLGIVAIVTSGWLPKNPNPTGTPSPVIQPSTFPLG